MNRIATGGIAMLLIGVSAMAKEQVWQPVVEPKPLSEQVEKGIAWLVEHQHADGGWGQGEESVAMQRGGRENLREASNVGDTCISVMALVRAGSTPAEGTHALQIQKGVTFICRAVEHSDDDSLWVTDIKGTRLQAKLGSFIDTFLASMVLADVKGLMGSPEDEARVDAALAKVMRKMERNQRDDGSFGGAGWANALSQSVAGKAYNRAVQKGMDGDESVRSRLEDHAGGKLDRVSGAFDASDAAGVPLYAGAGSLGTLQESDNANRVKEAEWREIAQSSSDSTLRRQAQGQLERLEQNAEALQSVRRSIVDQLDDQGFISGFGSNGGEEFLSYLNIAESLVLTGGEDWQAWDRKMTANLERIQNEDGSWTGHHCITGRNFCTAAALLVLTADRATFPVSQHVARR